MGPWCVWRQTRHACCSPENVPTDHTVQCLGGYLSGSFPHSCCLLKTIEKVCAFWSKISTPGIQHKEIIRAVGSKHSLSSSLRHTYSSLQNTPAPNESEQFRCLIRVKSLSHVQLFVTPWTAGRQASLSFTISWSLLQLMFIESVMPSNHLIICHPLFLLFLTIEK